MNRYSYEKLASMAEGLRRFLGLRPKDKVDMRSVVDHFRNSKDKNWRITFREAPASFMRQATALAEPAKRRVLYTPGLLERLEKGDPWAGLIFLEEIFHVLLKHNARVLNHSVGRDVRVNAIPELDAMEQEAEHMGWYFLAPISELYAVGSALEIIRRYELPLEVAERYFQHILKTRNRMEGNRRELPAAVIDFLAEQKKRQAPSSKAKPLEPSNPPSNATAAPSRTQYSGLLPQTCLNCGMPTVVVVARCKQCRSCGDEDGCN